MAKIFDCEDEPNEFMEAPCRCDCGKWFDLGDGHHSERNQGRIICRECAEDEKQFHIGDTVRFKDEFIVKGRTRAYYGDKGEIKQFNLSGKMVVKVEGKKRMIHNVPIEILEKYNY